MFEEGLANCDQLAYRGRGLVVWIYKPLGAAARKTIHKLPYPTQSIYRKKRLTSSPIRHSRMDSTGSGLACLRYSSSAQSSRSLERSFVNYDYAEKQGLAFNGQSTPCLLLEALTSELNTVARVNRHT